MNANAPANLNLVMDVPVSLTIELGSCQLPMKEVLQLNIGSVVQLDKPADAPVELSVNGSSSPRRSRRDRGPLRRENHRSRRQRQRGGRVKMN